MSKSRAFAALVAAVLLPGCGGASPKEEAEQAAIRWAEAWTAEDTERLCELTVLGVNGRPTSRPACENHWVRVFDERTRIDNGGDGWKLRSPEVTRSRVFEDSTRAEVEVTGSGGTVLVLDMSKKGDSWLVEIFDDAWGHNGP